ncbi:MAG: GatB/YqeY domain-containing protein [Clostridia bacterium]|nr:GatB/YqeY domain-containing protein [Clostridia bacterium]
MIIDDIKKANLLAMKEHNASARTIYSIVMNKFLLASIDKKAKNAEMEDADTIAILQKTIKELTEEAENYRKAGNTAQVTEIETQKAILEKYLPQMMSAEEIDEIIATLPDKTIPTIMRHFKANFAGKVDMSLVSARAKAVQ